MTSGSAIAGKARVLERREAITPQRNQWLVTEHGSRGSDVSKCPGKKGHPEKGYVGQAAIPPRGGLPREQALANERLRFQAGWR